MKNYCLSVALLSLTMLNPVEAIEVENSIEVPGYAEILVSPDIAKISFTASKTRPTVNSAQSDTSDVVDKLLKLLTRFNISNSDIRTTNISIHPSYRWDSSQEKQVLVGYRSRREVHVELKDLTKLGRLIQEASKLQITNISPPNLDSSKRENVQNSAYRMAFLNSKSTAATLAEAAGKTLGEVRWIEAKKRPLSRPMPLRDRTANRLLPEGEPNNYLAGEIIISASVITVFSLK